MAARRFSPQLRHSLRPGSGRSLPHRVHTTRDALGVAQTQAGLTVRGVLAGHERRSRAARVTSDQQPRCGRAPKLHVGGLQVERGADNDLVALGRIFLTVPTLAMVRRRLCRILVFGSSAWSERICPLASER